MALALCAGARADEVRQIAPDMFTPNYGDPNAPSHKLPPPPPPVVTPSPSPVADKPPPPPAVVTPSPARPYGACAPDAPAFAACLGGAANLADQSVDDAERAAIAAIGQRPGVNPIIADSAARGLRGAGEAWRMLRERECADLPLVESGLDGSLYVRRLVCRIRRDIQRVEFLRRAYGT